MITDTLSVVLDVATFQVGAASHPWTVSFKPGRVVEWRFENILLPDSNVNETSSHGLVRFSIVPVQPVLAGTLIENIANIHFDFNEPVITDASVLVATFTTGTTEHTASRPLLIYPQPNDGRFTIAGLDPSVIVNSIRVISVDGKIFYERTGSMEQRQFEIPQIRQGKYVLEIGTSWMEWMRVPLMIMY